MTGLTQTTKAISGERIRRDYGVAQWDGSRWLANIRGSLLDVRWLDPIMPVQGGKIVIDFTKDERGQSTALVIGAYADQPRPSTGVVLAVGVTEIVFTGEDGTVYSTDRFIGSYVLEDLIFFTWAAGKPVIIGAIPSIDTVYPAPPPAPVGTATGETILLPTASDTWGVGGWGRWSTSRPAGTRQPGEDVFTGTQSGYTVTGAWFYGAPKPELAGKTITAVQFDIPPRLAGVGAYNDPVTIYIYAHTSQSRPGTDVNRVLGPHPVTIQPGSPGGLVDLPLNFGPTIAGGGGLSIAGGPYTGLKSRLANPEYGKAILKWSS